ncbi:hypothetical protein PsorP6_018053 [Peronosclerospora sorghi]|uniref:Uncharacterized protein n=1 Tax=Peronosclerospora sorghi TaxID=230839 RepID=A0ACC0WEQ3_9STRA|nr:hypothetical protein PsorP6_018053 [Peronosclerospora sorghi]
MPSGPSSAKEQPMLGIGCDAVLAALATVVRKPQHKRKPAVTKPVGESIATSSFVHPLVIQDTLTIGCDGYAVRTDLMPKAKKTRGLHMTDSSMSQTTSYMSSLPTNATSVSKTRPTLKRNCFDSYVLKNEAQMNVTFDHESKPRDWKVNEAHIPIKVEPNATTTTTAKAVVVDFWLNDDARGEKELVKFIRNAVKTIKIGTDVMNQEDMIQELRLAVSRGIVVQVIIDVKKTIATGRAWIKQLLTAGVQVCHCTEKIRWKVAIFDGQVLLQGSPTSTSPKLLEVDMAYTMVHTGPVVSAFETQFDKIWAIATSNARRGAKRSFEGSEPSRSKALRTASTHPTHDKCIYFLTSVALLEMLGL